MNNIEKLLNKEKEIIDELQVPENLESKLRTALDEMPKKRKINLKGKVAAFIIGVLLLGYNMDTLAYYGRKLVGYENLMNGTLMELNEREEGQLIDKSFTFQNGIKATIDGIMLDRNTMVIFYTISSPDGNIRDINYNISIHGLGLRTFTYGGMGEINPEETEMKWVISTHEAPKFYENKIKFNIDYIDKEGKLEEGEITFKIDRKKALGKSIKMSINKKINLNGRNIRVESLVASPTSTIVKGKIQNILELGIDYFRETRLRPQDIRIILLADGKEIESKGSGMTTDMKGTKFEIRFDALPDNIKNLELKLESFLGDYDVDERIVLNRNEIIEDKVSSQDIRIDRIYEKNNETFVTITTEEHVLLSKVYLDINGKKVKLEETLDRDYEKVIDDPVRIDYTRTLRFKGTGQDLTFIIERISYNKSYNEIIYSQSLN